MSFQTMAAQGISKIYDEDLKSQQHFIPTVVSQVRNMKSFQTLFDVRAFYVPNNDYMKLYFGAFADNPEYDLYAHNGQCIWQNYIVFPIRDVSDAICGFMGFNWVIRARGQQEEGFSQSPYRISSSRVFNKGKFIYGMPGFYRKAVSEGYLVIVDGTFDMHSFNEVGINTGALVGSTLTDEVAFQLSFIEHIYIAEDNEDAGRKMYRELSKKHKNVHYIRQNMLKDADDVLKSEYRDEYLKGVRRAIERKEDFLLRYKPFIVKG